MLCSRVSLVPKSRVKPRHAQAAVPSRDARDPRHPLLRANASEIIHIGQAIMSQPGSANSLLYFINTTFNYPTMAEAYRVAALNGHNRLF